MKGEFRHVLIKGISAAVPENRFDNLLYAEQLDDKKLRKQIKLTGVLERRLTVKGQKASDIAVTAAKKLMDKLGWDSSSISVVIYVTQSSDIDRPSTAFMIQGELGIGEDCLVYDINMGCAGYTGGLVSICSLLESCKGRGLLLVGESVAGECKDERTHYLLEGDAASATALEYAEEAQSINYLCKSNGSKVNQLFKPKTGPAYMDGNAILLFGLNEVATSIREYVNERKNEKEIDFYVFHQAQKLIVSGVADEAGIDLNKLLISCDKFGNTSSASIPLSIVVNSGRLYDGENRLLLCGFGIGLAWDVVELSVSKNAVIQLIESDYIYDNMKRIREGETQHEQ